jgi:Glycosyl transferase family 2/Protein of unknown function (DUF3261)
VTIVVIPCYQGAAKVADVVRGARASGLDVVVVDDGSTDGSGAAAEAAGATVLRHAGNRGKGAALASGFAWAKRIGADAVLTMDADGQHDPTEIGKLVAAHERAPGALVVGVRSFAPEDMPRRSRIGNRISTWWISRFAGMRYTDTQSGFRVYPRALFDVPLRSTKFDTETELLLRAAKMRLPLVEVPIRTIYGPDRVTHFHGFRDTLRVIKLVLGSPLWLLLLLMMVAAAGCAHAALPATTKLAADHAWKTLRSEQKVTIDVGGKTRSVRALLAVERPDRVRLVAMGPAGVTLFDLYVVGGQMHVVRAIRDPNDPTMSKIMEAMVGDLEAAYDLEPRPAERKVEAVADGVTVEQPGVKVRETPARIDIDNATLHYKVRVDVLSNEIDVPLDPGMWSG